MIYSIQNATGKVFGRYEFPIEPSLTAEQWAGRLEEELGDIVGLNGVRPTTWIIDPETHETEDRVAVDVEDLSGHSYIEDVQLAIGFIALTTPPGE